MLTRPPCDHRRPQLLPSHNSREHDAWAIICAHSGMGKEDIEEEAIRSIWWILLEDTDAVVVVEAAVVVLRDVQLLSFFSFILLSLMPMRGRVDCKFAYSSIKCL